MIVGAIDIGTNTVLLLVAERRDGVLVPIVDRARIVRLGEGVDRARRLAPEAVQRTLGALEDYARELEAHGVDRVDAVGTSALRDAGGGQEFLDAAERVLGVRPRVIDGALEAELTFEGALSGLGLEGPVSVFDVGGGSTEIIAGTAGPRPELAAARSLDIGSVRLTERHVRSDPPSAEELRRVADDVEAALRDAPPLSPEARLVGVAGTVTTLAAVSLGLEPYDGARVHGLSLARDEVERVAALLASTPLAARRELPGLEPKRADVIVAGAEIVRRVLAWSGRPELVVSDRGVRWGVAERLAGA